MKVYGPYSPIYRAGNMFFISGQVGVDPATGRSASGIKEQTKQVLTNLKKLLEENSLSVSDVAKTTVFLTDMDDFAKMNEVYEEFFDVPRPARSTVAVKDLPRLGTNPINIEIEAIGYSNAK